MLLQDHEGTKIPFLMELHLFIMNEKRKYLILLYTCIYIYLIGIKR